MGQFLRRTPRRTVAANSRRLQFERLDRRVVFSVDAFSPADPALLPEEPSASYDETTTPYLNASTLTEDGWVEDYVDLGGDESQSGASPDPDVDANAADEVWTETGGEPDSMDGFTGGDPGADGPTVEDVLSDGGGTNPAEVDSGQGNDLPEGGSGDLIDEGSTAGGTVQGGEADQDPTWGVLSTASGGTNYQLQDQAAEEGEELVISPEFDPELVAGYEVDWGDGTVDMYGASESARHVYEDDNPTNTPVDSYPLTMTIVGQNSDIELETATVLVSNVGPTAVDDEGTDFQTDEDRPLVTGNVLTNDTDPSRWDLLTVVGVNSSMTRGQVTDLGDGTFAYDPRGAFDVLKEGEVVYDTFQYTIRDDDDADATSTATVTIRVTGSREVYRVGYEVITPAEEEQQQPARLKLTLSEAPLMPVSVEYRQFQFGQQGTVGENFPARMELGEAELIDLVNPRGWVVFSPGQTEAIVELIPVEDQEVEINEEFHIEVPHVSTDSYLVFPKTFWTTGKIIDNEWRWIFHDAPRERSVRVHDYVDRPDYFRSMKVEGLFQTYENLAPGKAVFGVNGVNAKLEGAIYEPQALLNWTKDGEVRRRFKFTFDCDPLTGEITPEANSVFSGNSEDPPISGDIGYRYRIVDQAPGLKVVEFFVSGDLSVRGKVVNSGSVTVPFVGHELSHSEWNEWGRRYGIWEQLYVLKCKKGQE